MHVSFFCIFCDFSSLPEMHLKGKEIKKRVKLEWKASKRMIAVFKAGFF